MHMADALISPAVAGTMYVASAGVAAYSIHSIKKENDNKKTAVMGVMGAFVFAAQMINFTIPGTGSSGHLCGGMLLSALLGPQAGFITMIGVLLLQCLMFGDGGLLALGCNIWNMAFYGCFVGALLIWTPIMKNGVSRLKIIASSIIGCVLTLQLGAFSVVLETSASGITELPFGVFAGTMQPIHLAIGFVEGLITAAVLVFVYEARPELLYRYKDGKIQKSARMSLKGTIGVLLALSVALGGGLSLVASENPDGLEWSIEKITGSTEIDNTATIYEKSAEVINKTALLPDYSLKTGEAKFGTVLSGITGIIAVIAICLCICFVLKAIKKRSNKDEQD